MDTTGRQPSQVLTRDVNEFQNNGFSLRNWGCTDRGHGTYESKKSGEFGEHACKIGVVIERLLGSRLILSFANQGPSFIPLWTTISAAHMTTIFSDKLFKNVRYDLVCASGTKISAKKVSKVNVSNEEAADLGMW